MGFLVSESTQRFPKDGKPSEGSSVVCKGDGWFAARDSCFKPLEHPKTHEKAMEYCNEASTEVESQEGRTRLAFIKTAEEQALVTAEMTKREDESRQQFEKLYKRQWEGANDWIVWLGAQRVPGTNTFKWDDGSEMNWTNWAPNEPKGWQSGADCVVLSTLFRSHSQNAKWATVSCKNNLDIPLCQKEILK